MRDCTSTGKRKNERKRKMKGERERERKYAQKCALFDNMCVIKFSTLSHVMVLISPFCIINVKIHFYIIAFKFIGYYNLSQNKAIEISVSPK